MAQIKDLLSGFSVIKSFKAEEETQKRFNGSNQTLENVTAAALRLARPLGRILIAFST